MPTINGKQVGRTGYGMMSTCPISTSVSQDSAEPWLRSHVA